MPPRITLYFLASFNYFYCMYVCVCILGLGSKLEDNEEITRQDAIVNGVLKEVGDVLR